MRFRSLFVFLAILSLAGCSKFNGPTVPEAFPLSVTPLIATLSDGESVTFTATGGSAAFYDYFIVARGADFSADVSNCVGVFYPLGRGFVTFVYHRVRVGNCQHEFNEAVLRVYSGQEQVEAKLSFR